MSVRYADCSSYFKQALARAKVEGRRALPRDVVVASACDRFPDFLTEEHVANGLDALLADGTFKLTAGGKIALGKTREMRRAIAANGFERALDLSCDILAHVLSFADVKTLSASEIASRSLSTHASPAWRDLVLSDFPMLRLVMDNAHHEAPVPDWRRLYYRSFRKMNTTYGNLFEVAPPAPPALSEYTFVFEIWSRNPQEPPLGAKLIETGTWDLNTNSRTGDLLVKPLESLSTPLPLPDDGQYLRALVAKSNSLGVEFFVLYTGQFYEDFSGEPHVLNYLAAPDLIMEDDRYDQLTWSFQSPTPVTRVELCGAMDPDYLMDHVRRGVVPESRPGIYMAFLWQDEDEDSEPMQVSHLEHILDRYAEWYRQ